MPKKCEENGKKKSSQGKNGFEAEKNKALSQLLYKWNFASIFFSLFFFFFFDFLFLFLGGCLKLLIILSVSYCEVLCKLFSYKKCRALIIIIIPV